MLSSGLLSSRLIAFFPANSNQKCICRFVCMCYSRNYSKDFNQLLISRTDNKNYRDTSVSVCDNLTQPLRYINLKHTKSYKRTGSKHIIRYSETAILSTIGNILRYLSHLTRNKHKFMMLQFGVRSSEQQAPRFYIQM